MPCFKQETSYWCGPATGKQVVHFHNGTSASQATIAAAMGTTSSSGTEWTAVRDYVNAKQNKCFYVSVTPATKQRMEEYVLSSVSTFNSPPILQLKFTGSLQNPTPWEYSTGGHYVNAHTIYEYSVNKPIGITDPYIQRIKPSSLGYYTVDSIHVWNATQAHWKKHLMY